jgi:CelD/BcsL family acetyltransferase involved in cellulose biosynthesis
MNRRDPVARFADLDELRERREEWRQLANSALEANPFYGPDLMIPALEAAIAGTATRLLIVERGGSLEALFPLQRPFFKDGAMSLGWMLYRDPLTCLTVPLLAREEAEAILAAALAHLGTANGPPALVFPLLPENRPFAALLTRLAAHEQRFVRALDSWERPAIARGSAMDEKTRSSIEKKRRKLEKTGPVALIRMMSGNPGLPGLLADFLEIEAASWKGQGGTAIRNVPVLESVFRTLAAELAPSPTLLIEALMVGERPCAINLNIVADGTVYTVKSTYHPDFASHSPGRLLDALAFHLVEDDSAFRHVDSCAGPGHPLGNLWPDREDITSLALALRPMGRLNIAAMGYGKKLSDSVRRWRYRETYTTRKTKRAS